MSRTDQVPRIAISVGVVGFITLAVLACWLALTARIREDYPAYLIHWETTWNGPNPWASSANNTYGPGFVVFAPLAMLHPLAPRVLFTLTWLACAAWLLGLAIHRKRSPSVLAVLTLLLLVNPFFWHQVPVAGYFDILPAAAILVALRLADAGRDEAAGLVLASAILMKYYPLVVLPFLALKGGSFRWRLVAGCGLAVAAGMALSWLVWGNALWKALIFAGQRNPRMLSIFAFLRGRFSPVRSVHGIELFDEVSVPLMVIGLGLVLLVCLRRRLEGPTAILAGLVAVLLLYKVGHPQFYTACFLIVASGYIDRPEDWDALRIAAVGAFLAWLAAFELISMAMGDLWISASWLKDAVGLPTFVLGVLAVLALLRRR